MTDLFERDRLNQVKLRLAIAAKIEALKEVLHHRTHFPELAAKTFLQAIGG